MTIRFAAAWGGKSPAIMRALCPSAPLGSVNDNGRKSPQAGSAKCMATTRPARPRRVLQAANDQRLLTEALRHFAQHGLSAAAHACTNAETARASGDEEECRWWISICRQLDRPMAEAFARKIANLD